MCSYFSPLICINVHVFLVYFLNSNVMGAGHTIYFRLHFNVDVIVRNASDSSWPQLALETSGYHSSIASYVGGSGSTILR